MADKTVRRCLGCGATYPADEHACPSCGSHAAEVEEALAERAKPKPARAAGRPRKT